MMHKIFVLLKRCVHERGIVFIVGSDLQLVGFSGDLDA